MKRFFLLLLFISLFLPLHAEDINGNQYLKKGKSDLDKGRYEEAIYNLNRATKEFPLLGDYALLWLSDAFHETGKHKEALETIQILLNKYPNSPLTKKARIREIQETQKISEENIQQLYKSYLTDYPKDSEIEYLYASWLKQSDNTEEAKSIFKGIYVDAGQYSDIAYRELDSSDIKPQDMIERASNLINRTDYKRAESLLRVALKKDDGSLQMEILKKLGYSLFKQKKYREAAEVYKQAKERYWELRSLYRAGEKHAVYSEADELLNMGDQRAASILLALASDKRREGNINSALSIYQKVIESYSSEKEDAIWGIGWTHYLGGQYAKAADIFSNLHNTYQDPKYLYWHARSLEANGGETQNPFTEIQKERNFYSVMSYAKSIRSLEQTSESASQTFTKKAISVKKPPLISKKHDRIEALLNLGFPKEALSEIVYVSKYASSMDDILYFCSKFAELGQYRHSVRLAARIPYTENIHYYLYPFAFNEIIEKLSKKYDIDPLLIYSIIREESRFDNEAMSPAGAIGLMQLMPGTAYRYNSKLKLGIKNSYDIFDTKKNIHIGIYYLSSLIKEFGSYACAIAAYNAGEDRVRKWLQNAEYKSIDEFIEDIPYNETKKYVKRVITTFFEYKRLTTAGDEFIEIPLEKL